VGSANRHRHSALLQRGFEVACVEPGARLAAAASRNLVSLPAEIHVSHFDTFTAPPGSFTLVFAAPPGTGSPRRSVTATRTSYWRREGTPRLWSAFHTFPAGSPVLQRCRQDLRRDRLQRRRQRLATPDPRPDRRRHRRDLGQRPVRRRARSPLRVGAALHRRHVRCSTPFSSHIAMPAAKREYPVPRHPLPDRRTPRRANPPPLVLDSAHRPLV